MRHVHGLFLFVLCFAGGARRSKRISDSHQDAQQQNSVLADDVEVSAEAQEALIPSGFQMDVVGRGHIRTGAPSKEHTYRESKHRRATPSLRFGPRHAADTLRGGTGIAMSERDESAEEASAAAKGVWFGAELLGRAAKRARGPSSPDERRVAKPAPSSFDEAIERLQLDYSGSEEDPRPYFLTGVMDEALYDEDCEFADPFVSFRGRQRFVDNLANLAGGFITESSTRVLETRVQPGDGSAPPSYSTKLLVKLRLGLPWSPVLAWPWGVLHEFDASTGLIVRHIESWDVSPAEGIRQLFTAGGKRKV